MNLKRKMADRLLKKLATLKKDVGSKEHTKHHINNQNSL